MVVVWSRTPSRLEYRGGRSPRPSRLRCASSPQTTLCNGGESPAPEGLLGRLVQVVVLLHQLLQLALHVGQLGGGELVLVQRNLGGLRQRGEHRAAVVDGMQGGEHTLEAERHATFCPAVTQCTSETAQASSLLLPPSPPPNPPPSP